MDDHPIQANLDWSRLPSGLRVPVAPKAEFLNAGCQKCSLRARRYAAVPKAFGLERNIGRHRTSDKVLHAEVVTTLRNRFSRNAACHTRRGSRRNPAVKGIWGASSEIQNVSRPDASATPTLGTVRRPACNLRGTSRHRRSGPAPRRAISHWATRLPKSPAAVHGLPFYTVERLVSARAVVLREGSEK
jgi:hypothetical protein